MLTPARPLPRLAPRFAPPIKAFAALSLGLLYAAPSLAQTVEGQIYYYTTPATINTDISGNDVVVGRQPGGTFANSSGDTNLGTTNATRYTVNVATGAKITASNAATGYDTLSVLNLNSILVTGGSVSGINAFNTSTVGISGGSVDKVTAYNNSTLSVSGGTLGVIGGGASGINAYTNSTVNVSNGTVVGIYALDNSRVTVSGGTITGVDYSFGTNITNITGGQVNRIDGFDSGRVNISGGNVDLVQGNAAGNVVTISGGTVGLSYALNGATESITGGTVGAALIYGPGSTISGGTVNQNIGFNNAVTTITGGNVGLVQTQDTSTANISGGTIGDIVNNSIVNISGGTLNNSLISAYGDSTLNLTGSNFSLTFVSTSNQFTSYFFSGTLTNGQSFSNIRFRDYAGGRQIGGGQSASPLYFNGTAAVVTASAPEPSALALLVPGLAMGATGVVRRRLRRK